MNNVNENIEVGVNSITLNIPLRVTMTSYDDAPFEFTASIDNLGQIILTPASKYVEFVDANTDNNVETEVPFEEMETIVEKNGNLTTKKTTIFVQAVMLSENDNNGASADIDEIGQCVIYPLKKENSFISVTFSDSLNLITEDLKTVNYFGYTLTNSGDGWDIRDYTNKEIETGVATEAEAKMIVLQTELKYLQALTEEVTDTTVVQDNMPEVEVEVLEERVDNIEPVEEFTSEQIKEMLTKITNNYTDFSGGVSCDTISEKVACLKILQLQYRQINVETDGSKTLVYYSEPIKDDLIADSVEEGLSDDAVSTDEVVRDDGA